MTQQLANEDSYRSKHGMPSIASEIAINESFTNMATVIAKKTKDNSLYLKTGDAWLKRFKSITVAELTKAVSEFVKAHSTEEDIQSDTRYNTQDTQDDTRYQDVTQDNSGDSGADENKFVTVALGSLREDDELSAFSIHTQTIEDDDRSTFSIRSKRKDDSNSVVSFTKPKSAVSLASSNSSRQHQTLADASFPTFETEDDVNTWYNESLNALQTKQLRDEQYRRKRALLRVEYWTKMDRLRNNAEPTVVNWRP